MSAFDPALDYCTAWIDGIFGFYWGHCCYDHDVAWAEMQEFLSSNWALADCVNVVLPGMGTVMFCGVSSLVGFFIWLNARTPRTAQRKS